MKGQLYIGDDMVAETVEVVAPPREGDLIIYQGKRLRVREMGHNIDRKKLQIMCHATRPNPVVEQTGEIVPDLTPEMIDVAKEVLGIDLDDDLETE